MLSIGRAVVSLLVVFGMLLGAVPRAVRAAEAEYVIGTEDLLDVSVWQAPELSAKVVVSSAGTVVLPLVGEVKAAGLTASELARQLTESFSIYKRDAARVTVRVEAFNSRAIFVIGQVAKPGKYPFEEIPDLWGAVKEAGGPLQDAFLGEVRIVRGDAQGRRAIRVDLEAYLAGRSTDVPKLEPGDTIVVPKSSMPGFDVLAQDVVFVEGEVAKPGSFSMGPARDLLSVVLLAGGFSPNADRSRVSLVRRSSGATIVRSIDVRRFQEDGDVSANPRVEPGDWISVPRLTTSRGVFGTVSSVARDVAPLLSLTALVISISRRP
jgi:polysaccharide export outer membrane protein